MAINYPDGGGNNRYVPDFTDVNVVPGDLATFADLLDADLIAIKAAWDAARGDVESGADPNFPGGHPNVVSYSHGYPEVVAGASAGLPEAMAFGRAYFRTVNAEYALMDDLIRGLERLRDAAREIHAAYLASDAANAASVEGAFAAYERSAVIDVLGDPALNRTLPS